jgi:hypothetical protein
MVVTAVLKRVRKPDHCLLGAAAWPVAVAAVAEVLFPDRTGGSRSAAWRRPAVRACLPGPARPAVAVFRSLWECRRAAPAWPGSARPSRPRSEVGTDPIRRVRHLFLRCPIRHLVDIRRSPAYLRAPCSTTRPAPTPPACEQVGSSPVRVPTLTISSCHLLSESSGLPEFSDASLPAYISLMTPADIHALTKTRASCGLPARQHCRHPRVTFLEAVPALQGARSPLVIIKPTKHIARSVRFLDIATKQMLRLCS